MGKDLPAPDMLTIIAVMVESQADNRLKSADDTFSYDNSSYLGNYNCPPFPQPKIFRAPSYFCLKSLYESLGDQLHINITCCQRRIAHIYENWISYPSFYLSSFISYSYGFNKFDVILSNEFITGSTDRGVSCGQEFYSHFGLIFDIDILNND